MKTQGCIEFNCDLYLLYLLRVIFNTKIIDSPMGIKRVIINLYAYTYVIK